VEVAAVKKRTTQQEKDHMGRVAELGCIVCADLGYPGSPAELHHIANQGVRASHWQVIPLCAIHHRNGSFGEAVHNGRRTWESIHGTEKELLSRVNKRLGVY